MFEIKRVDCINLAFCSRIFQVTSSESDPECSRILGPYGLASKLIQSSGGGSKADILGVDRQPATPLPSKEPKEGFFPKSSRNPNIQRRLIEAQASASSDRKERDKVSLSDRHQAKLDIKVKEEKYSNKVSTQDQKHKVHDSSFGLHKGHNSVQNKESSHIIDKTVSSHDKITSVTGKSDSNRRSHGDSRKQPNLVKSHSPSSHVKPAQPEKSSTQSVEKEIVTHSKSQPIERESILSTFGKEFASTLSASATSSSKSASISPDKSNKTSANRPIDSSILKEKEANRNGMVNPRGRPKLQIPSEVGTCLH